MSIEALQERKKALDVEYRIVCEQLRKTVIDCNRTKRHTPAGVAARNREIELNGEKQRIWREIEALNRQVKLIQTEALLAEATCPANTDGLLLQIHLLKFPVSAPAWWDAYPEGEFQERQRLYQRIEAWGESAARDTPKDFTQEMRECVSSAVQSYLQRADNSKDFDTVCCEAVRVQIENRDWDIEQERKEALAQIERYKELKPFTGFNLRTKEWGGNSLIGKDSQWACDGAVAFRIPETPDKTAQKLLGEHGTQRVDAHLFCGFVESVMEADHQPATLLGWRDATFPSYSSPLAYFEAGGEYHAIGCYQLVIIQKVTQYDEVQLASVTRPLYGRDIEITVLCFLRAGNLVGIVSTMQKAQAIAPPAESL